MSEKLYLPISLLLSALILSGTMFLVGGQISNQVQLTGLTVAGGTVVAQPSGGGTAIAAPAPIAPAPTPSQAPSAGTANLATISEGKHVIYGDLSKAKVTIVEYSDFECPFCNRSAPTLKALSEKYGDDVVILYGHFPLSFHPSAVPAAIASECVSAQDESKFKGFHDKLFGNQTSLNRASYEQYATELGLDAAQFSQCLDAGNRQKVDADFSEGSQNGVSGTPTFFIGLKGGPGSKLVGAQPQNAFEALINPLLAG